MIEELAWINFEKRGSKLPISVLYYGGHYYGGRSNVIRNQSLKSLPESTGSFYNGHFTLCSVSCIKSRIMFARRKQTKKGGKKTATSVHIYGRAY